MRSWILLLFALAVVVAIAHAERIPKGGTRPNDKLEEKPKRDRKDEKPDKIKFKSKNGLKSKNENKRGERKGLTVDKPKQKSAGKSPRGEKIPKGRKSEMKHRKVIKGSSKRRPQGEKTLKRKGDRNPKKIHKSIGKQLPKECPGTCVEDRESCQGRLRGKRGCSGGDFCCVQEKSRKSDIKRFCSPLKPCNKLKGECRKKKTGCNDNEKMYKSNKKKTYCTKKSCICCVINNCSTEKKCSKLNGICQMKKDPCEGTFKKSKKYCKGKKCGCCIPGGSNKCKPKKTCSRGGGTCQALSEKCDGEVKQRNDKGKKYCKGKTCGCCLPISPAPTTTKKPIAPPIINPPIAPPTTTSTTTKKPIAPPIINPPIAPTTTKKPIAPTTTKKPIGPPIINPPIAPPIINPPIAPPTTKKPIGPTTTACSITRAYCTDCGVATISVDGLRIVNGAPASPNEFPYQVALFENGVFSCGGSIIKKKWILTAAHCFFDNGTAAQQNDITVRYGTNEFRSATEVSAVRYITHENYVSKPQYQENDIALVELPSELNYENDPSIHPICLAEEADIPFGGQAVASGWGNLVYDDPYDDVTAEYVTELREVALDIITIDACVASNAILPPDPKTVICTLTPTKGPCQGDSGGPLVAEVCPNRWVQIGIVSFGYKCAEPGYPAIYTRVSAFRTWIDTHTGSPTTC